MSLESRTSTSCETELTSLDKAATEPTVPSLILKNYQKTTRVQEEKRKELDRRLHNAGTFDMHRMLAGIEHSQYVAFWLKWHYEKAKSN